MDNYIEKTKNQLKQMTENEKDEWIISQAKILPVWKQEEFYKTICGTKKLIGMPERSEITEFCKKVANKEITVEYLSQDVEIDEFGNIYDESECDYLVPERAMYFVASVIRGCHDLVALEDYEQAFDILDEILGLKFFIVDHSGAFERCETDFMDLNMAIREGSLYLNRGDLLRDYVDACRHSVKECNHAAEMIVKVLEMELFKGSCIYSRITIDRTDPLLEEIKKQLKENLERYKEEFSGKRKKGRYDCDEERIIYLSALVNYFEKMSKKEKKPKESFLWEMWSQISERIIDLKFEPCFVEQVWMEEIWNIVEVLLKRGEFEKEPWKVKKSILEDIYHNAFYVQYDLCDPMKELENAICTSREENLKRAEIMMKIGKGNLCAEAAKLYRELGEEEVCIEYYENHLGREEGPYLVLLDYYKDRNHEKAIEFAALAIQKCQEDQTPFFIFLLQDAKDRSDEETFKKLMRSAHRRLSVDPFLIDAYFEE